MKNRRIKNVIKKQLGGIKMSNHMKTYFRDFLREIRLTDNQVSELKSAHETLRRRLNSYDDLKGIYYNIF